MMRSILSFKAIAALAILFSISPQAVAQFAVTSSSPAHGDTNVPLNVTVSITFNAPVDTTAAFEDTDGFFLNVETIPEVGEPSSIALSPDGMTFTADVVLEADTKYILLLSGAVSESGEPLDRPYLATFTTGNALPTGSVSGTVTEVVTKMQADGAVVAVFPDDPATGLFGSDDGDPTAAALVGPGGAYTIDYVDDGSYIAVSIRDADKDGLLDFGAVDPSGLYDADNDALIDAFDVVSGGAVNGIDITIMPLEPVRARENAGTAQTLAETFYSDAHLTNAAAEVDVSGRSSIWIYLFYSPSAGANVALVNLGFQFAPSGFFDDGGGAFDVTAPLPDAWLNSDDVMTIAQTNGGSEFISEWSEVEIFMTVVNFTGSFGKRSGESVEKERTTGLMNWRPRAENPSRGLSKTLATTPTPIWFVSYFGSNVGGPFGFLDFMIHAVTGAIDPPLASYTSGRENIDAANGLAAAWSSDAALVKVESGFSGVHPSGLSSEWNYTYYSATLTKTEQAAARLFSMEEGQVVNEMDVDVGTLFSTEALPENWIDTPAITATADENSDGFRSMNSNSFVQAVLSKGLIPWDLSRPVWQYDYSATSDSKTVLVNAVTGAVIVASEGDELPSSLTLDQNYPNPFNPSTTISYEIPSSGGVTIRIFDALGRQVRLLVDRGHTPGAYTAVWDGRDDSGAEVSSGIYIYKLEAGREASTRSMILLR